MLHYIFVVWSVLVVGRRVVAAWGRKSYLGPAEISSVANLVKFKDRDAGRVVCIASAKSRSAMGASR